MNFQAILLDSMATKDSGSQCLIVSDHTRLSSKS